MRLVAHLLALAARLVLQWKPGTRTFSGELPHIGLKRVAHALMQFIGNWETGCDVNKGIVWVWLRDSTAGMANKHVDSGRFYDDVLGTPLRARRPPLSEAPKPVRRPPSWGVGGSEEAEKRADDSGRAKATWSVASKPSREATV